MSIRNAFVARHDDKLPLYIHSYNIYVPIWYIYISSNFVGLNMRSLPAKWNRIRIVFVYIYTNIHVYMVF